MKLHVGVYSSLDNMVTFFPENKEEYELSLRLLHMLQKSDGRVIINNDAVEKDRIVINRNHYKGE